MHFFPSTFTRMETTRCRKIKKKMKKTRASVVRVKETWGVGNEQNKRFNQ